MVDFAKLKANRSTNTAKLLEAMNKTETQSSSQDDSRFWKPTLDDEKGVGAAVIRFLPVPDEATLAYSKYFEHAFKGDSGKWYIEKSLSTIGQRDCMSSLNSRLWGTGVDSDKELARKMKRQTRYITNILVVNDPAKPENNGKVFLYRFGPKVFEFIETLLKPAPDELTGATAPSVDAFDMWEGANLQLRMTKTKYGWNYDKTDWSAVCPVAKTDEAIQAIYEKTQSLAEFTAPSQFKTPEALEKRLVEVLGNGYVGSGVEVIEGGYKAPQQESRTQAQTASAPSQPTASSSEDDDLPFEPTNSKQTATAGFDDDDAFFEDLMK